MCFLFVRAECVCAHGFTSEYTCPGGQPQHSKKLLWTVRTFQKCHVKYWVQKCFSFLEGTIYSPRTPQGVIWSLEAFDLIHFLFWQRLDTLSAASPFTFHFASFDSRLHSNNLHCDCHLAWLAQWLRQRPTVGLFTQCTSPAELRGLNVAEVQKHEFSCSGNDCIPSFTCPANMAKAIFFPPSVLLLGLVST